MTMLMNILSSSAKSDLILLIIVHPFLFKAELQQGNSQHNNKQNDRLGACRINSVVGKRIIIYAVDKNLGCLHRSAFRQNRNLREGLEKDH